MSSAGSASGKGTKRGREPASAAGSDPAKGKAEKAEEKKSGKDLVAIPWSRIVAADGDDEDSDSGYEESQVFLSAPANEMYTNVLAQLQPADTDEPVTDADGMAQLVILMEYVKMVKEESKQGQYLNAFERLVGLVAAMKNDSFWAECDTGQQVYDLIGELSQTVAVVHHAVVQHDLLASVDMGQFMMMLHDLEMQLESLGLEVAISELITGDADDSS